MSIPTKASLFAVLRLRFNRKFLKKTRFYKLQGRNKACKKKCRKAYPCERRLAWDLDTLSAARGDCNDVLCGFWIRLLGKSCDFKESPKVHIDLGGQFERSWRAPNLSVLYTITTNLQDTEFTKKTLKRVKAYNSAHTRTRLAAAIWGSQKANYILFLDFFVAKWAPPTRRLRPTRIPLPDREAPHVAGGIMRG